MHLYICMYINRYISVNAQTKIIRIIRIETLTDEWDEMKHILDEYISNQIILKYKFT